MHYFNHISYGDMISYRHGADAAADLTSGLVVAVFKDKHGLSLQLVIQTGKNQFRKISRFDKGYIISCEYHSQKYRHDIRENKPTEIKIDETAVAEENAANKWWLSKMFDFDGKGNSIPIKLPTLRDKIVELAHSTLYDRVWVDWFDFLNIRQTFSNGELIVTSDEKIIFSYLGKEITIYRLNKSDFSCYHQVFLSHCQTPKDAELDRLKNPGRRINYSDIATKLDVERVAKVLASLDDVPLKPEIQIVAGSGLTPSSDALSYSNSSSGNVTLSDEVTVPFRTLSSDTSTHTIPDPEPVVPTFIVPSVDPLPNIIIPGFTETIGKFVDGLGRLADVFFENTTKKEPAEMSKKHTIYSRAFKDAYSGLRHLWVNPQDYCDEFVSKDQPQKVNVCEFIYHDDGDHRIVHSLSSIPPGFIYFSFTDKTPTDIEIEKQSGNLLDIQAGTSISVDETLSRFKKARKAFENVPATKNIVDQPMAIQEALDQINVTLKSIQAAKDFQKSTPDNTVYVKVSDVSSTDDVASVKSDVNPIDHPMDSEFLNIECDHIALKNYLQHGNIFNIYEEFIAPYTITALDFDRLLDEGLKEVRYLSELSDLVAEQKPHKNQEIFSNASYTAWNVTAYDVTVVYGMILMAFHTMDVFQTKKGREQLDRWSLKRNAIHFHLQSCAINGQANLIEIFNRDTRNKIRKILAPHPNNLTFTDEESLMEMKMSESFKDHTVKNEVEDEEVAMSKSIVEDITDTYDKAKWRVAQRQLIKRLRDALILAISQFGHDRSEVKLIEKALKTQLGEGVLALAIGFIGSRVDFLVSDPRAAKVLDESKIEGMAAIGDDVIERVAAQVAPMVMAALSSSLDALPEIRVEVKDKPKKVRIKSKSKAEEEDDAIQEHEADEEKTSAKRASASR